MQARHWLLFAGCLAGIGAMLASLDNWAAATSPVFVGGMLTVVGTQIGALFTNNAKGQP